MKVAIFGHSYVKQLARLGNFKCVIEGQQCELEYIYKSGASYKTFLDDDYWLQKVFSYSPDMVVVILGGNDILNNVKNATIYEHCKQFYGQLKEGLPGAKIVAAQVECRFYNEANKWNAPSELEFKKRRNDLNCYLRRLKLKDYMHLIAGPNRLDNQAYFKDAVHLSSAGIKKYFVLLKQTITFIHRKSLK